MQHSFDELERAAYISGNAALAALYDNAATLDRLDSDLPSGFDFESPMGQQIDAHVESEIAKRCPDAEAYRVFFYDCFARLDGHYPCPSVTSDYDCSFIFDAITGVTQ
jgi:hypothetical protein